MRARIELLLKQNRLGKNDIKDILQVREFVFCFEIVLLMLLLNICSIVQNIQTYNFAQAFDPS